MLDRALQKYWRVCIDILSYEHISNESALGDARHHFELSDNYFSFNHLYLERSMGHDEQVQYTLPSLLYFKCEDFMSIITLMTLLMNHGNYK